MDGSVFSRLFSSSSLSSNTGSDGDYSLGGRTGGSHIVIPLVYSSLKRTRPKSKYIQNIRWWMVDCLLVTSSPSYCSLSLSLFFAQMSLSFVDEE